MNRIKKSVRIRVICGKKIKQKSINESRTNNKSVLIFVIRGKKKQIIINESHTNKKSVLICVICGKKIKQKSINESRTNNKSVLIFVIRGKRKIEMKHKNNIRTTLGLKQEELAQLLQVSRSQLSLYELGKRSLPLQALEKMAIMLQLSQKKVPKSEKKKSNAIEEQKLLQNLLLKNSHQQLIIERKIKAFEKKQNALVTSKQLIAHLLKNESKIKKNELAVLKSIEIKSKKQEIEKYNTALLQLEIKKEVLVFEEKVLQKKLQSKN